MKNTARRIEELFIGVAFAEERAIRFPKNISSRLAALFDNLFTAITFAKAGEVDFGEGKTGVDTGGHHADYLPTFLP